MSKNFLEQQRLKDLEDNIARSQKLLKDFEEASEYERDPRIKAKYEQDIERQRKAIAKYQDEYSQLLSSTNEASQKSSDLNASAIAPDRELSDRNVPRAVILTALELEYNAIASHLESIKEEKDESGTIYEKGIFKSEDSSWEVGIAQIGAGNNTAGIEGQKAIAYFKPDVMMFVGVAGGIKDVKLGDVVAATKIYGYASGKDEKDFKTRPDVGQSTFELVERAKVEARKNNRSKDNPKVFVAPIAAGEKVVADTQSATFKFIRNAYNDAIAVEMEGSGFIKAAYANSKSAIVIRGISDCIDDKTPDSDLEWQDIAAANASAFAFQVLSKFEVEPRKK